MEQIEMVRAAKNGDNKSFSCLIKLYENDLYRIAKAIVKSDDDVLDCIQDTILRAYKGIKYLAHEEYFKTWLTKILINCCNNYISQKKNKCSYIENSDDANTSINDDSIQVDEALQKLEKDMKLPIILYYFEDMSISDIGESLNLPEGTVKSRLFRARKKLKELLDYKERSII